MARVKRRATSALHLDPAGLSKKYELLKEELRAVGYIALGSVAVRRFTCGKSSCACAQDPKQRHGPYYHWTRKVRNKTLSRILPPSIMPLVRQAIRNRRLLNRIIARMLNLSVSAFEAARIDSNP